MHGRSPTSVGSGSRTPDSPRQHLPSRTASHHPARAKRVATASGNNWVVLALAVPVPKTDIILALPLLARLHVVGKNQPSPPDLAKAMLLDVLGMDNRRIDARIAQTVRDVDERPAIFLRWRRIHRDERARGRAPRRRCRRRCR